MAGFGRSCGTSATGLIMTESYTWAIIEGKQSIEHSPNDIMVAHLWEVLLIRLKREKNIKNRTVPVHGETQKGCPNRTGRAGYDLFT